MEKHARKMLVVIAEAVLERRLLADCLRLGAQGYTVRSPIDVLLASFCISNGHMLLHRDEDFDVMAALRGLRVVPH